jgi:transcriptional regulator with XRE-family HTH domain
MGSLTLDELRALTTAYRKERKLKQTTLARVLKISRSSLSRFERGERCMKADALKRLCEHLGTKYDPEQLKMSLTCPNCHHRFSRQALRVDP